MEDATSKTKAIRDVIAERFRQVTEKGYSPENDDNYVNGELGLAAALYALPYGDPAIQQDDFIGLQMALELGFGWKLTPEEDDYKRIVKAAALLIAELERLNRAREMAAA